MNEGRTLTTRMRPGDLVAVEAAARAQGMTRSAWAASRLAAAALDELDGGGDPEALTAAARDELDRLERRRERLEGRIAGVRARLDAVAGDEADEDTD